MIKQLSIVLFVLLGVLQAQAQVKLIPRAISAEDHKRKKPLDEAISAGFAGISAELKVNRNGEIVCGKHPLKGTYLQPLHELITQNKGAVYPGKKLDFVLYLEIGEDSMNIYKTLRRELEAYSSDYGIYQNGERIGGPVIVVLTGCVPFSVITQETKRLVMVADQAPSENQAPELFATHLNFGKNFSWDGEKNMPNMQYHSFVTRVKLTKKAGKKVVLSNYPDRENAIEIILKTGVDYLLVDDIPDFVKFWENRNPY